MKVRSDFVTNSSSSSFVITFKDKNDAKDFIGYCEDYRFGAVLDLVKHANKARKFNDESAKESAIKTLDAYFKYEKYNAGNVSDLFNESDFENYLAYRAAIEKYIEENITPKVYADEDYKRRRKMIEEAAQVTCGTIWDSDGGLLEYAIRNGLLESQFRRWCPVVFNVG